MNTTISNNRKKILDQCYPIILKVRNLLPMSSTELIMVVLGDKPTMVDTAFLDTNLKKNLHKIRKHLKSLGLYLVISYKFISDSEILKKYLSDEPSEGKIIFSISKSKNNAKKSLAIYFKRSNNKYNYIFGKLMGYPECCLKFGIKLNNKLSHYGFRNPGVESLLRSTNLDWRLNIFSTPQISHFPCCLSCKKSIKYVDKILSYQNYVDKIRYKIAIDYLTKPVSLFWTNTDKILIYGKFTPYTLGTGEIKYHTTEPMITQNTYYHQPFDKKKSIQWKNLEKNLHLGDKLIVTHDYCRVYKNNEIIFTVKKEDPYIPLLVKPDILS